MSPTYVGQSRIDLARATLTTACDKIQLQDDSFVTDLIDALLRYNRNANSAFHTPYLFDSLVRIMEAYLRGLDVENLAEAVADTERHNAIASALYWTGGLAAAPEDGEIQAQIDE